MSFDLQKKSLLFAPMEGITDEIYRKTVMKLYPEWDRFCCDFLRVPNPSPYPTKHLIKHFGGDIYRSSQLKEKTIYQILTSPKAYTEKTVSDLEELGFNWLDLNLGCPSKTVCRHEGGSYLLSDLKKLEPILKLIRKNFKYTFTCKIRVGYEDDSQYLDILKLIEDIGVDAVTIHARTRAELYKGFAKWDYVKQAVETINIPVIGNGDIWTLEDINKYYEYTGCHSIMLARSALKTPWMARLYKNKTPETPQLRLHEIKQYFSNLYQEAQAQGLPEISSIKRIKSVSRYLFEDLPEGEQVKRKILLSKEFESQISALKEYQGQLN